MKGLERMQTTPLLGSAAKFGSRQEAQDVADSYEAGGKGFTAEAREWIHPVTKKSMGFVVEVELQNGGQGYLSSTYNWRTI